MLKLSDKELIHENRIYLDHYYKNGNKLDNISKWKKALRIYKTFGIMGVLKKTKKNKLHFKKYVSNITEEQTNIINMNKSKIAVYTAIIGKYDELLEPKYVSPNCDYYIFTDMDIHENSIWKKKKVPNNEYYKNLGKYQKAKYFKIFPHHLFPDYEYSIWVDGNICIYGDLSPFVQRMESKFIAEFEHPNNDCIYDEAFSIVSQGKAKGKDVKRQISAYKNEGFPEKFGLMENSFIVRKHNNEECINLMNTWWNQMEQYTWRDQLSLTYSLWKCGLSMDDVKILGPCWRWNPRLRQNDHIK